jgi:kynurenine formamidase
MTVSEFVDLTRPFDADAEHSLSLPAPEVETLADVARDGANVQRVCTPTHAGTHVDAPRHVLVDGPTVDEYPLSRLTGEGVVLGVEVDGSRAVDRGDLVGADTLRDGDAVLLSFGWAEHAGTEAYHRYPWLSTDLADWLLARDVSLLGMDTLSPDEPRESRDSDADPYPVHRRLLRAGVPVVENLADPSALVGERVEVVCAPLSLRGGDGAPCRVLVRPLG